MGRSVCGTCRIEINKVISSSQNFLFFSPASHLLIRLLLLLLFLFSSFFLLPLFLFLSLSASHPCPQSYSLLLGSQWVKANCRSAGSGTHFYTNCCSLLLSGCLNALKLAFLSKKPTRTKQKVSTEALADVQPGI
jgi:hypothetical protein